jgi:hypothetical protein
MSSETNLELNESLRIIDEMVQKARFNFSQGSFYFIYWGVLLIVASLGEYVLRSIESTMPWMLWPIVGIVGGVGSWIYGMRRHSGASRLHLDRVYSAIWMAFFITLLPLLLALVAHRIDPNGYVLIVAGMPTFLTGMVLQFKVLKWGGVALWLMGLIAIFIAPEQSSLCYATGILLGYVIPGFVMRSRHHN